MYVLELSMYYILVDAHLSNGDDVFSLRGMDLFEVSRSHMHVCVSTPPEQYCILIDTHQILIHLFDGDRMAMHDVFPLSKVSSHMYVLVHTLRLCMYFILIDAHLSNRCHNS